MNSAENHTVFVVLRRLKSYSHCCVSVWQRCCYSAKRQKKKPQTQISCAHGVVLAKFEPSVGKRLKSFCRSIDSIPRIHRACDWNTKLNCLVHFNKSFLFYYSLKSTSESQQPDRVKCPDLNLDHFEVAAISYWMFNLIVVYCL